MKQQILAVARGAGLLRFVDRVLRLRSKMASRGANLAFSAAHPDFVMPPDDLAFDAYNHLDHRAYWEMGLRHAGAYARVIAENEPRTRLAILEWGCGPGRIIRHLRTCLPDRDLTLTGSDCNARSIAWCSRHIPGIDFCLNGFLPPLPFADETFDVTYNCSVFTHLSAASQRAWSAELRRVLKPGGLLICSTHGNNYYPSEAARFNDGGLVVRDGYEEGKKWFLAIHPPSYVQNTLLAGFSDVRAVHVPPEAGFLQDLWLARKPAE